MSTVAVVREEDYLSTVYEPDCEFADGVLIERNVGEQDHSWMQAALAAYFFRRRKLWKIEVYTEQRHRVRSGRYMLPDVCVIPQPRPDEKVFSRPPLIWIEILSLEDNPIKVNDKLRQLHEFGVPNIWVIDPETLEAEVHTLEGSYKVEDGVLRVDGSAIEIPLKGLEE
jgi:Uma2 family endonuclease